MAMVISTALLINMAMLSARLHLGNPQSENQMDIREKLTIEDRLQPTSSDPNRVNSGLHNCIKLFRSSFPPAPHAGN